MRSLKLTFAQWLSQVDYKVNMSGEITEDPKEGLTLRLQAAR
jgi:hypothetical protein